MDISKIFKEKKVTYSTIIEINDESNDFILYWDLAMKDHLSNNFITVETESSKSGAKSLNSFFIKLVDKKEGYNPEKSDLILSDKLFIIDVYRIKKYKDFNSDFIKKYKNNHNTNNLNVILYNIDDIKDYSIQNVNKTIENIKYKMGLSDFSFVPYNLQNFSKFYSVIDQFFLSFKEKLSCEYKKQLNSLNDKINNINDIYNSDTNEVYEYLKNKILYIDLLSMGEFWEDIKKTCDKDLFKIFKSIETKYLFTHIIGFAEINLLEVKQKTKSKILNNIEYQIYLIYNYIKSCRLLRQYNIMKNFMCNSLSKLDLFSSFFKSIFHFYYWKISFLLNYIHYLNAYKDILKNKELDNINIIEICIINLYSICYKNMKIYANNLKINIPSTKILILMKECVDKGKNIKEELDGIISGDLGDIEKDHTFNEFKFDIKVLNYNDKNKNKMNLYDIFTNKKRFLEECLLILQLINKKNCEFLHSQTSIRNAFEIIPLLLCFNKFEEAKNYLNSLLELNLFKCNKWYYTHEYICLIFVMLLNCLEKNKLNLNIMFKLLNTNFTKIKFFLNMLGSQDENLINDIISKYIESYIEIESENKDNKLNKVYSLDRALDITLEKKKDDIIFINKLKTKKEQIKYKFTNKTGITVNIEKIQLIFEEFAPSNNENKEKKQIIYEIDNNSNTFKQITPFLKSQENVFDIILDESNDIFQLNTTYKFKEIKYIIKNSLCGIYHIKEEIKICINLMDIKIYTQVFPSYDTAKYSKEQKDIFYYNVLSKINIDLIDMPDNEEFNNKSLKFIFEDMDKKDDTTLIIQTQVLKEKIIEKYPNVIIDNYSIEFPPGSLKDKEKLENLIIPFYVENINFYANSIVSIKIMINILDKNNNDNLDYSFSSYHNFNLIHLFNIKNKFRILNNNFYLMQNTFSLNIEANNIKVYTHNSNNYSFYIDTTQALNLVLLLGNNEKEIIEKLRKNFLKFSIDETKNEEIKKMNYRLCYPEKNILEEIKELKHIPYHIIVDVDDCQHDVLKEILVDITIKKYNKKKVLLLAHICENEKWAIIGKTKIIEEWTEDKEINMEKNMKFQILPLVDGFLKLPQIEFFEYEIQNGNVEQKEKIKFGFEDDEENIEKEIKVGKMEFEAIEYGTVFEGNKKVIKINPITECSLKINLT